MELEFTPDQDELRASIRAVLAKECPIGAVRALVEDGTDVGLWPTFVSLDWPALTIPESVGGMGFGDVELAVLAEELGRVVAPGALLPTLALFAPVIAELGTTEQVDRFLGPVASGSLTGTLALADAGGSWDPADVTASARADGDGWVLAGTKHYVIEGDAVDELAVAVRVDGELAVFVVPASAVTTTRLTTTDATRRVVAVALDGVRVDGDRRLGAAGTVAAGLRRALDVAAAAFAMEAVGTCTAIFELALEYAKDREQFGVKIGSFQAMKHKFADMYVALEAARATCYFAAVALAEDDPRRSIGASMAKGLAGDACRRIGQEGIQSLGGIGYTWEHDMQLYVKRVLSAPALLGTVDEHRERVAALLGVVPG